MWGHQQDEENVKGGGPDANTVLHQNSPTASSSTTSSSASTSSSWTATLLLPSSPSSSAAAMSDDNDEKENLEEMNDQTDEMASDDTLNGLDDEHMEPRLSFPDDKTSERRNDSTDPTTITTQSPPPSNQSNEENKKDRDVNPSDNRPPTTQSWTERLVCILRNSFDDSALPSSIKRHWKVGLALTILSYIGCRHVAQPVAQFLLRRLRERRRLRNQAYSDANKADEFRKLAVEAPLSTLYRAMAAGNVEKAWVGTNVVYYSMRRNGDGNHQSLDTSDSTTRTTWNRSSLPARNSKVQTDILERLSSSSPSSSSSGQHPPASVSMLQEKPTLLDQLATPFWASLPFVYLALLYRMLTHLHRNTTLGASSDMSNKTAGMANSSTTFDDVGGLRDILAELKQIIAYGQNPARYQAVGASPPRGVLLFGPPGTGKTLLARALAGQSSVDETRHSAADPATSTVDSFTVCSASEFVEVYVGRGASRIRDLFANARKTALENYHQKLRQCEGRNWLWETCHKLFLPRNGEIPFFSTTNVSPHLSTLQRRRPTALIFIDELDAVAKQRDGGSLFGGGSTSNDEREQTLNQLLTEMDGYHNDFSKEESNVLVIVMAASNRAHVLDPAVLRRFDLQLAVPKPDCEGRKEILRIHVERRLEKKTPNHGVQALDYERLANLTDGMTGSDLKTVVNDATLLALRHGPPQHAGTPWSSTRTSLDSNSSTVPVQVTMAHFEQAIDRFRKTKQYTAVMTDGSMSAFLRNRQKNFEGGPSSQPTPLRSNKSSKDSSGGSISDLEE